MRPRPVRDGHALLAIVGNRGLERCSAVSFILIRVITLFGVNSKRKARENNYLYINYVNYKVMAKAEIINARVDADFNKSIMKQNEYGASLGKTENLLIHESNE